MLAKGAFKQLKKKIIMPSSAERRSWGSTAYVFINHGRSNPKAIKNAIFRAHEYATNNVNAVLSERWKKYDIDRLGRSRRGRRGVVLMVRSRVWDRLLRAGKPGDEPRHGVGGRYFG